MQHAWISIYVNIFFFYLRMIHSLFYFINCYHDDKGDNIYIYLLRPALLPLEVKVENFRELYHSFVSQHWFMMDLLHVARFFLHAVSIDLPHAASSMLVVDLPLILICGSTQLTGGGPTTCCLIQSWGGSITCCIR